MVSVPGAHMMYEQSTVSSLHAPGGSPRDPVWSRTVGVARPRAHGHGVHGHDSRRTLPQ